MPSQAALWPGSLLLLLAASGMVLSEHSWKRGGCYALGCVTVALLSWGGDEGCRAIESGFGVTDVESLESQRNSGS